MGRRVIRARYFKEGWGHFSHLGGHLSASLIAALAGVALLACPPALAQSNDDCLMCHQDPGLNGTRAGQTISVHVNQKTLASSVHRELECVACHQDLSGAEFPHAEEPKRVDCGACHDQEAKQHSQSLHGQAAKRGDKLAPSCGDCHGAHDIVSPKDPKSPTTLMNVPTLCGRCHHEGSPVSVTHDIPQDRIMENYS